jgi:hypothetical protein
MDKLLMYACTRPSACAYIRVPFREDEHLTSFYHDMKMRADKLQVAIRRFGPGEIWIWTPIEWHTIHIIPFTEDVGWRGEIVACTSRFQPGFPPVLYLSWEQWQAIHAPDNSDGHTG